MEVGVEEMECTMLDEGIARLFGVKDPDVGGLSMADIRAKAASMLSRYSTSLLETLGKQGIKIPPAVQLHCPDEGHVVALGDHPSIKQISDLINNDISLFGRFKEVEVLHVMMRRAELRLAGQPMTCQHFNLGLTSLGCIAYFTEG